MAKNSLAANVAATINAIKDIKNALIERGAEINADTHILNYGNLIRNAKSGASLNIEFTDKDDPTDWDETKMYINIGNIDKKSIVTNITNKQDIIGEPIEEVFLFGSYTNNFDRFYYDEGTKIVYILVIESYTPIIFEYNIEEEYLQNQTSFSPNSTGSSYKILGKYNNKIYIAEYSTSKDNSIWYYDIETKEIHSFANFTEKLSGRNCAMVGSKIYSFGGQLTGNCIFSKKIEIIDVTTKDIRQLEKTVGVGPSATVIVVGTTIYLMGGYTGSYSNGWGTSDGMISSCQKFDTTTEILTSLTSLPQASEYHRHIVYDNKIYLIGGYYYGSSSHGGSWSKDLTTLTTIDLKTNKMVTTEIFPTNEGRSRFGIALVGNYVYLFGGTKGGDGKESSISPKSTNEYGRINLNDLQYEKLGDMTFVQTSYNTKAIVNNNFEINLFIKTNDGFKVVKYNTTLNLEKNHLLIVQGLNKNKFNIVNTEETLINIGVNNVYFGNIENKAYAVNSYVFNEEKGFWYEINTGIKNALPQTPYIYFDPNFNFIEDGFEHAPYFEIRSDRGIKVDDAEYEIVYTDSDNNVLDKIPSTEGTYVITINIAQSKYYNETSASYEYVIKPNPLVYTVETVAGASYGFNLQSDGSYLSSNRSVTNSASVCKIVINALEQCPLTISGRSYGESNYDYGILYKLDTEVPLTSDVGDENTIHYSFKGKSSSSFVNVVYQIPAGEHFIYVKYRKDSSTNSGDDTFTFKFGK